MQGFYERPEVDNAHSEEAEELDHLDAYGIRERMERVVGIRAPWDEDDLADCSGDDPFPVSAQRTYKSVGNTDRARAQ